MTSNLRGESQLREFFRPEFLNRLDEVLTFDALKPEQIASIVDVQIQRLADHLAEQELSIELTDAAKAQLATEGYDPEFGARPSSACCKNGSSTPSPTPSSPAPSPAAKSPTSTGTALPSKSSPATAPRKKPTPERRRPRRQEGRARGIPPAGPATLGQAYSGPAWWFLCSSLQIPAPL
ncbi:MAG: hypothetical protein R3F17_03115 [Planctomycetota bacterium]